LFFRGVVHETSQNAMISTDKITGNKKGSGAQRGCSMEFDLQPTLKGNLIEIRPLTREDFDALFAAASDPLIWEQHPENDRYTKEVFQRFFDGAIDSKGAFAIVERKSGRIIGSSRYCNLNPVEGEVEVGWTFLERPFWGGSYNRELKSLMLDHAFRFVDRVLFVVGEKNFRSQKALQKIGARFLKKAQLPAHDGAMTPNLVFVITRAGSALWPLAADH
jgi:RimJ/RimL family protein N-acetyltransferase